MDGPLHIMASKRVVLPWISHHELTSSFFSNEKQLEIPREYRAVTALCQILSPGPIVIGEAIATKFNMHAFWQRQ